MRLLTTVVVAALVTYPAAVPAQRAGPVPAPAEHLGFEPGADRRLPSWSQVRGYFAALDRASPRIQLRTLGTTTMGRPFIAAFIADSAALANLPRYRDIQQRLADPRRTSPAERARLAEEGRVVVLVTSSIHSTEVGAILAPLVLAHRLVTSEDPEARSIRSNVITILVPSLNPDGVDIVTQWYASTLGTPWEGNGPPVLYHKYTGHDNNRDWYAFTQVETRLTIDSLHNVWKPQIVNDIHQQQSTGSRLFIPPYMDPIEPNVDPLIVAGVNAMGMSMAWRLTAEGKTGIAVNASYDAWTPARSYQHYHGGIRILTETASARMATPIEIPFDSLRDARGYDPREASWNFVQPWPGGPWALADIIDYQVSSSWALLGEAARGRSSWLSTFSLVQERAVAGRGAAGRENWPIAFVIPSAQRDAAALTAMIRILQRGQVEVRRTTAPVSLAATPPVAPVRVPTGSYVIYTAQPYGAFAKALLERQVYPDRREYPGGPPRRPYDVTAHTLPLLMGVRGVTVLHDSVPLPVSAPIAMLPEPRFTAAGLSGSTARRIAIYRSNAPSMDEGWTRWVFEQYRVPFTSVGDREIRAGALNRRFDVIVLPDQSSRLLATGVTGVYPDSLRGGIGDEGANMLRQFVEAGGTLVAFNRASLYAISILDLPVRDALGEVEASEFYGPGSLLRVELRRTHPIARDMGMEPAIWFEGSPAFEITDPARATAVASYPAQGDPLLSGWLLGGSRLAGKAALVEVRHGSGRVVLFGFRPQYRAQSVATYGLMWGAMR